MNILIQGGLVYALDIETAKILQQEFPDAVSYRDPEGNLHPDYESVAAVLNLAGRERFLEYLIETPPRHQEATEKQLMALYYEQLMQNC